MPAILSHHLFGRTLLARKDNKAFLTREARDAFLLGNQGPDPLFYATRTPHLVSYTELARRMHHEHIAEYLESWREVLNNYHIKDHEHEILLAYIYGFLCHYTLDSSAHPYIYAYEEALCTAGVVGLDERDRSFVHGQLEADLDVYLLYKLTGRTITEYHVPKQLLYASEAVLSSVDALYRSAAQICRVGVARRVFTQSVKDMRVAMRLLYSPGGTKRSVLGKAERLVRRHSLLQAMSHCPEAAFDTWFANEDNETWTRPDTLETSTASYLDVFKAALDTAQVNMQLFGEGVPVTEITKGLDFAGKSEPRGGER